MRRILIPLTTLFITAIALFFWLILLPVNISSEKARMVALEHIGAQHANLAERELERFQRVWAVEVFHEGLMHEVFVNVNSGEIVRVEVD